MSGSLTSEAEQIQQEMVRVRSELHEDVEDVVASARALTDWRQYVRKYPWVCLGAAAAAGYLIVPARRKPTARPISIGGKGKTQEAAVETGVKAGATAGILGSLVSMAGTMALRGAMNYASRRATAWMDQRMSPPPSAPPVDTAPRIYSAPSQQHAHLDG